MDIRYKYVNKCVEDNCNDNDDVMKWQLNLLSNSWEWWVTSELTVEEWCDDSAKVRRLDLEDLVLVKNDKIMLTIFKYN